MSQALKIALRYVTSQTPPIAPVQRSEASLTDNEIHEIAQESIRDAWGGLLTQLNSLDVSMLFLIADYLTSKFSTTGVPEKEFETWFYNQKKIILRKVKDLAEKDKGSISDEVLKKFQGKPDVQQGDIEDYVNKVFSQYRNFIKVKPPQVRQKLEAK